MRYLMHGFNLSGDELALRWSENVVWQYFRGRHYYTRHSLAMAPRLAAFALSSETRPLR